MKKLFTLGMFLVLAASLASAQGYRKWDFTNWSAQTVANLQAEAAAGGVTGGKWSDTEKATGDNPQPGNCYWSYADNVSEEGYLMANDAVIAETDGLIFNTAYTSRRSLAIAVNYSSTSLGEYAGPQYLWLGGGNAKSASARLACFTIPKVRVGQKITFTVESHKPSDTRGVSLFVADCTDDTKQIGESFKPTTLETYTWEGWTLPEGAATNADGTVDVVVYNTNGCHIYTIEVGDNSQKSRVCFLYEGSTDSEPAFAALSSNDMFTVEPLAANKTLTIDELSSYDAIVIAPSVANAEAIASLKDIRPFVPVLNMNTALYEAWGMGTTVESETPFAEVKNTNHALFRGIELIDAEGIYGLQLAEASYKGITLAGAFAADQVLATVMEKSDVVAIHAHNLSHNGYLYLPGTVTDAQLIGNAIQLVAGSKAEVTQAPAPTFTMDYKNMLTYVTIKSTVPGAEIFYTTDGSNPTEDSQLYTEPIEISTSGVTVKAVARGEGYLLSDVAEQAVELKQQAATPTFVVEQKGNTAVVTIECGTADASIYYNLTGSEKTVESTLYSAPFALMSNQTVTAFAMSDTFVQSEAATQEVAVQTPLVFTSQLAHMDAAKDPYYDLEYNMQQNGESPNTDSNSKVAYFFSWGKTKTAYPYYDTTAEPIETIEDPETGDETYIYPMNPEEKFDFQNGWAIRSRGHVICEEITIKPGTNFGEGSSYNPESSEALEFAAAYPQTDFYLNISEWNTTDPRSGMIYTTQKYQGPFAILSYISNGNSGTGPKVVFETGTDIEGDAVETEWQQVGDTCTLDQPQRLFRKFVRVYTGTDEVYVRTRIANGGSKAGFYDIYILGVDPSSVAADGIYEVADRQAGTTRGESVYSLNGMRLSATQRGVNIIRRADGTTRKVMVQ